MPELKSLTFDPVFYLRINDQEIPISIARNISSFVFEDNKQLADMFKITICNPYMELTDHTLLQKKNWITSLFGYTGNLSVQKMCQIMSIEYDFPEGDMPTITLNAYDAGVQMAQDKVTKTWEAPAPGISYSEIAIAIANKHKLKPIVEMTTDATFRPMRVSQDGKSDIDFLNELVKKIPGFICYIQDDELHFHQKASKEKPQFVYEYFGDGRSTLRSFRPDLSSTDKSSTSGEVRIAGVDPRKRAALDAKASNADTPNKDVLGKNVYSINADTGEGGFVKPSADATSARHEEQKNPQGKDAADAKLIDSINNMIEATAVIIGNPRQRADSNIEIRGVGRKFSGVYYVESVRHTINDSGYSSELKLKRNSFGETAGDNAVPAKGIETKTDPKQPVTVSAE